MTRRLHEDVAIAGGSFAHIALLALLTLYFLVWPLWRVLFPIDIAWNEGWNAYFADAAGGKGGALYPAADTLIVNNYPPLSFYALGWAQNVFGDALYIGRVLSVLATLGIGAMVARIVVQLGAGRVAAAIAGIWFVAIMARSFDRFVGMNDPQLAAQFLMVVALSWFLSRDRSGKSAVPPVLLMVVAGFWKHSIVVIPATTLGWLILRDRWRALWPLAIGVAAAALGLALCIAIFGDAFVANLLTPRAYSIGRALGALGRLQWVLPALIIWALWAWRERATTSARFTALYIAIALVIYVILWSGEGVLNNAQFDLVIAAAIGAGLAYDQADRMAILGHHGVAVARTVVVLILVLRLLATLRIESFLLLTDPAYRAELSAHAEIARAEARRVGAMPGPVACYYNVICRMAGKPHVYDDFRVEQLIATGRANGLTEPELLRQRGITEAKIDPAVSIESLYRELFTRAR
jgi:hypothetical protein